MNDDAEYKCAHKNDTGRGRGSPNSSCLKRPRCTRHPAKTFQADLRFNPLTAWQVWAQPLGAEDTRPRPRGGRASGQACEWPPGPLLCPRVATKPSHMRFLPCWFKVPTHGMVADDVFAAFYSSLAMASLYPNKSQLEGKRTYHPPARKSVQREGFGSPLASAEWGAPTFAGDAVHIAELVASPAVALVGAVHVGTLLATRVAAALVHV